MSDDRLYPDRPFVGVGVVVWRDDHVLLIRRGKPPRLGEWSLPGGMQEVGETVVEAGLREVHEETGIEARILGVIDVVDAIRRDGEGGVRTHYTLVDLVGVWVDGDPVPADDALDAAWIEFGEALRIVDWEETRRILRMARGLVRAPGRISPAPRD